MVSILVSNLKSFDPLHRFSSRPFASEDRSCNSRLPEVSTRANFVFSLYKQEVSRNHVGLAMTPTWNDLANGARWRGVVSFIRNWVGPFDADQGMAPEELDMILRAKPLNLPAAVRQWYLLAANWDQVNLNVWIPPQEVTACDGIVCILTDTKGINHWGIRVADLHIEDPPVVSYHPYAPDEENSDIVSPTFSTFVAAMVVNDVLFDYETEEPVDLNHDSTRTDGMCPISSCCGDFFADGPLESATILMFAYPGNGPVSGKARTPEGRALLRRLQQPTT